ncbi:TIR domain-containing protein [Pseudovibrio sp. POLY-S9]|uniref:TIR domain-containing protein n=1 Tax=Pseudovibrio sp. POLY-S9 TaxID=1576596 RepID=UPI000709ADD4|nr:TIR domain-containing protein [Pseudovibrio sp. POLY-S9]
MARKVFFSFHFKNDHSRTQLVRNMNALEGNSAVTPNKWEEIKKTGDAAIKRWINANMSGKSCVVVLVGSETASRPWVKYEIRKAWEDGKGVLGIHINGLKDLDGNTSTKGANPFLDLKVSEGDKMVTLGKIPPMKTPSGSSSKEKYASIKENVEDWIEEAISIRKQYK